MIKMLLHLYPETGPKNRRLVFVTGERDLKMEINIAFPSGQAEWTPLGRTMPSEWINGENPPSLREAVQYAMKVFSDVSMWNFRYEERYPNPTEMGA